MLCQGSEIQTMVSASRGLMKHVVWRVSTISGQLNSLDEV